MLKLVVIGGGPAGESAARFASKQKAKVLLIEKENLGGLCLNHGCIPSKALLSSAKKLHDLKTSEILMDFFKPNKSFSANHLWEKIQEQKRTIVDHLKKSLTQVIQSSGIETIFGEAKFLSPHQLQIFLNSSSAAKQERIESFDKCIIASGSAVVFPPPLDQHKDQILDSDRILDLKQIPESLLVVGGGAVGCEFACLLHEMGSKVTIVEKTETLLPGEDAQVSNHLRHSFEKRGIRIFSSTTITALTPVNSGGAALKRSSSRSAAERGSSPSGDCAIPKEEGISEGASFRTKWEVTLSNGKKIEAAQVLACVGRKPHCGSLDLEKAGVRYSHTGIQVDEFLASSNPHIYAVGDVNGFSLLAHAGSRQGEIAAANALGAKKIYNGQLVPRCLYTWPEVASVGLWKYEADAQGREVKARRFFFTASGKALAEGDSEGFIQILCDLKSERILGAQIIGPHATEMIHIFSLALQKQMTRQDLTEIIFAHPTLAEGIRSALDR